jgi:hypothetical protein
MNLTCTIALVVQVAGLLLAHVLFERLVAGREGTSLDWVIPASLTIPIVAWLIFRPPGDAIETLIVMLAYPWPTLVPTLVRIAERHLR